MLGRAGLRLARRRYAKTGQYVTKASAAQPTHDGCSIGIIFGAKGSRSVISGKFVKASTAKRQPDTTITDGGS